MSRWRFVWWLILGGGAAGMAVAMPLQGSEWRPVRIMDLAVPEDSAAYVQFRSKGRLAGFTGCNRLFAEYHADQEHLLIGPVAATRKACADSVMRREAALASALEGARTYQRHRADLVLFDADGMPILEFRQNDWD